ncbi:pyridine nucleotide-disulfide oxidoreductase [Actinomadura pelletieri DSM 43383]|uniref:Pyridine nucleotide-disulfide oxidoreductase n=1 Tax=Actinomadura pelletieri DSM 43383 TaxID=1120940 RepID=A0A495Q9U1_9ACTN|nr:FAD-dependent oxidoreductase [Actinomadura pelletieri]RKS68259.1 pyridine nucleotide-disulfide oxidoreductase [Actinomadura pelletieri DSM 43383]
MRSGTGTIVIVGGSVAATTASDALRRQGHDGPITVLSEESYAPYVRPPLSKAVLKGTEPVESVFMTALPSDVTLRTGARATGLDAERRRVLLAGGEEVPYDGLILATGARARRLGSSSGELVVRDLDDALALRDRLTTARSALIIGGGFLGMEIASSARSLGIEVTVIDQDPHLVRQFGRQLAARLTAAATAAGVVLARAAGGVELLGGEEVTGVRTGSGTVHEADVVITAAGCRPNVEWLAGTGLASPAGVRVDSRCRVRPDIVAAGDLVARPHGSGGLRRTPHWASALDQARVAAAALVRGAEAPVYRPRPFFWTEQWGLDIKIAGEIRPGTELSVLDGSLEDGDALVQWVLDGRPVAAGTVNRRVPIGRLHKLAAPAPAA